MDTDIVQVRNIGNDPIVFRYGGNVWPVNPGKTAAVPTPAVKRSVGDWTKSDDPDSNFLPRTRERNRLATLYGLCGDPFYSDDETVTLSQQIEAADGNPRAKVKDYSPVDAIDGRRQFMHPSLPRVEVSTLEGERIITVLDDPDDTMAAGTAFHKINRDRGMALEDQVAALQRQIDQLTTAQKINRDAAIPSETDEDGDGGDGDTDSAGDTDGGVASDDAMDAFKSELGHDAMDPEPKPAKKAAAKKAAARRVD